MMTLSEMRAALKNQSRADEAIFWFGAFYHSGPDSDLYRAMCETGYDPSLYQIRIKPGSEQFLDAGVRLTPANDPEIVYCHKLLVEQYGKEHPENFFYDRTPAGVVARPREFPLHRIKLAALKEDDIVFHGPGRQFACIEADWPCRVFKHHGDLGVPCAEDKTKRSFHSLKIGPDGYVIGFRR